MSNKNRYQYLPADIELTSYETPICYDYSSINTSNNINTHNNNYNENYQNEQKRVDVIFLNHIFEIKHFIEKNPSIRSMFMINLLLYSLIFLCLAKFQ